MTGKAYIVFYMKNDLCNNDYFELLSVIWSYLKLDLPPQKADCIIGFGNYNLDIPRRAAELFFAGYSDRILFSGGFGRNTLGLLSQTEAERFAQTAMEAGVPEEAIILEVRSSNTAENILFSRALLKEKGISAKSVLGVHQPCMERRIAAAMGVYWPECIFTVTSPEVTLEEFLEHAVIYGITCRAAIEEITGDFERIETYAAKGWQLPQVIPDSAREAFAELQRLGFTGQLSK